MLAQQAWERGLRVAVRKVTAHQSIAECEDQGDRRDVVGNDQADIHAKEAVCMCDPVAPEHEEGISCERLARVLEFMADCMRAVLPARSAEENIQVPACLAQWGNQHGRLVQVDLARTQLEGTHHPFAEASGFFVHRFAWWIHALRWVPDLMPDQEGITVAELGVRFVLESGSTVPTWSDLKDGL